MILTADECMADKLRDLFRVFVVTSRRVRSVVLLPLQWLRRYYSIVLEKPVSMRQTRLMTVAQLAFFATVMPVEMHLFLRMAACVWFIAVLLKCRAAFKFVS